jgi:hypothetical protein
MSKANHHHLCGSLQPLDTVLLSAVHQWFSTGMPRHTRVNIFSKISETVLHSIGFFGCETWLLTSRDQGAEESNWTEEG